MVSSYGMMGKMCVIERREGGGRSQAGERKEHVPYAGAVAAAGL